MSNFRPVDRQTWFLLPPSADERRAAGSGCDAQAVVTADSLLVVATDVVQAAKARRRCSATTAISARPMWRHGIEPSLALGRAPRYLSPAERFPPAPPAPRTGRRSKPWRAISGATKRRTIRPRPGVQPGETGVCHEQIRIPPRRLLPFVGRPGRARRRGLAPRALQGRDRYLQAVGSAGPAAGMDAASRRRLCRPCPRPGRKGHVQGGRDRPREHARGRWNDSRAVALSVLSDPAGPAPEGPADGTCRHGAAAGARRRALRRHSSGAVARFARPHGAGTQSARRNHLGRTDPHRTGRDPSMAPG